MIARFVVLVQIALRNLVATPLNMVVGVLILLGAMFFVVLGGLVDSVVGAMSRSLTGSLSGDLQVYSAASKDELALFGGGMGGEPNLTPISDFPRVKRELLALPGVREVVPMGSGQAIVTAGNILDVKLEQLRNLAKAGAGQPSDPALAGLSPAELAERTRRQIAHVRQIIRVLESDGQRARAMLDETAIDEEGQAALRRVSDDAFWAAFESEPFAQLEYLENRIAPQVSDAQFLFLRYVGTDFAAFRRSFDRMRIVKGEAVPPGRRGFLVADFIYEEQMKLKTARRLDKIRTALAAGRRIQGDDELERFVRENRTQVRELVLQLDAEQARRATEGLQRVLGPAGQAARGDLSALLAAFLDTDDATFAERYDFFYRELAPMLELYRIRIGDVLTIKAFTKSGYVSSVNVKVWGTFAFSGLEDSILAGATNLMDIGSFRELYGYLSAERAEELEALKRAAGTKTVTRESAEAELFGEDAAVVAEAAESRIEVDTQLGDGQTARRRDALLERVATQEEIDDGVVLSAAVLLADPAQRDATIDAVRALSEAKQLGLRAVSWQKASGQLGSMVDVFRIILLVAVALIFFVTMIVINIAMMMATLQRTQVIGTMRAMGAQRSFVLLMILNESGVLAALFGSIGVALGAGILGWLGHRGIAAFNDVTRFLFSGPRLEPAVSVFYVVVAFGLILVVTALSTLFPAAIATRVSPLRAMQSDE